jgi:Holliday junction resolvase-like predicted endonuclease
LQHVLDFCLGSNASGTPLVRGSSDDAVVAGSPGQRVLIGREAEALAARSLACSGWVILSRNLRLGRLEIDLLARDPHGELVAVEVRRRTSVGSATPSELLGRRKMLALRRQRAYLPEGCRVDLLLVLGAPGKERLRLIRGVA